MRNHATQPPHSRRTAAAQPPHSAPAQRHTWRHTRRHTRRRRPRDKAAAAAHLLVAPPPVAPSAANVLEGVAPVRPGSLAIRGGHENNPPRQPTMGRPPQEGSSSTCSPVDGAALQPVVTAAATAGAAAVAAAAAAAAALPHPLPSLPPPLLLPRVTDKRRRKEVRLRVGAASDDECRDCARAQQTSRPMRSAAAEPPRHRIPRHPPPPAPSSN